MVRFLRDAEVVPIQGRSHRLKNRTEQDVEAKSRRLIFNPIRGREPIDDIASHPSESALLSQLPQFLLLQIVESLLKVLLLEPEHARGGMLSVLDVLPVVTGRAPELRSFWTCSRFADGV